MYLDGGDHNGYMLTVPGSDRKHSLVFVFSEYCGYCRAVKPVFEEFCQLYKDQYNCYMVDVNDERGRLFLLKNRMEVNAVPKFLKYQYGILQPNVDLIERTVEGMVAFMR